MRLASDAVVFGYDEEMGVTDYFEWDAATETFRVSSVQDVEDILEYNKALFNQFDERSRWGEGKFAAYIPSVVRHEMLKQGIGDAADSADGFPRLRKWLNDRDNSGFRTFPGRV